MATAIALFSNLTITQSSTDVGRIVSSGLDWMSIGISVLAVSGVNPTATFRLQWSFDNVVWADSNPPDTIGTATRPVSAIQRFAVKAPYWRLAVDVGGTSPSFICTANALI